MEKVIGYLSEAYMEDNSGVKVTYAITGIFRAPSWQNFPSGTTDFIAACASVTLPKEANALPATVTFKKSRRVIMVFSFYTGLY